MMLRLEYFCGRLGKVPSLGGNRVFEDFPFGILYTACYIRYAKFF